VPALIAKWPDVLWFRHGEQHCMLDLVHSESPITRDDLRTLKPVAAPEEIPPPERVWPDEDWDLIRRGHKAADMDDKWHAYVEGQRLYLHRSWTGLGIYEAGFGQVPGGWQIITAVVTGDHGSYRRQDDEYESALLEALIDGQLLGTYDGPGHQRLARAHREPG
jgi:hypothetical protein